MSIRIDGTNTTANPGITGSDTDTGLQFGTNEVKVVTDGTTRATVDSSGRLLSGLTSAPGTVGGFSHVNIGGTSINANGAIGLYRNTASPSSGQGIGAISFANSEGNRGALIQALSGGTWGTNDYPGVLAFSTTADGASSATERVRIDSSGRVGIGTSSPAGKLTVYDGSSPYLYLQNSTSGTSASDGFSLLHSGVNTFFANRDSGYMAFETSGSESMRMTSGGTLIIGSTDSSLSATGSAFTASGSADHTRDGANVVYINRLNSDGNLIQFYGDTNYEGSISISGSTISYNGGHLTRWSQLAGAAERTEILRGSVLSNLDEMCEWAYEAQDAVLYTEEDELPEGVSVGDVKTPAVAAGTEDNEQLNRMKISDVEGDVNVAGVFQAWDDDDDNYTNDFYCAMTGDFIIRIAQGTTVARGDLLMSAGNGTAKPQGDDIIRSKTIAKVTSTTVSTTYSDGSYCVPCVLMAC